MRCKRGSILYEIKSMKPNALAICPFRKIFDIHSNLQIYFLSDLKLITEELLFLS